MRIPFDMKREKAEKWILREQERTVAVLPCIVGLDSRSTKNVETISFNLFETRSVFLHTKVNIKIEIRL